MLKKKIYLFIILLISVSKLYGFKFENKLDNYLKINTFMTIGASTIFDKKQEFKAYTFQRDGVSKDEINFVNNTLVGGQATLYFLDSFSGTLQGFFVNDYKSHYKNEIDWLYLTYRYDDSMMLRVGKFRLPLFKSSELTTIGYARTTVRPELSFYGIGGFPNLTGINGIYYYYLNSINYTFELSYGTYEGLLRRDILNKVFIKSNNLSVIKATIEKNFYLLSFTYFRANSQNDTKNIQNNNLVNRSNLLVEMLGAEGAFYYKKFTWEWGYGKGMIDKIQPNETLIYSTLYYQIGDLRPYLMFSSKKFEQKKREINENSQKRPPLTPKMDSSEKIYGIGLRYDFTTQASFKIEFNYLDATLQGLLVSDNSLNDQSATALSMTIDMVF